MRKSEVQLCTARRKEEYYMNYEKLNDFIVMIDDMVWGVPLIVLIMAVGLLLTVRSGGIQFRCLGEGFRAMFKKTDGDGEVSSFEALCTALSATIGTGNIVGVATAVCAGGPGALFWMVVAACVGIATKFAECMLAVKYREVDANGHVLGGPFYYIEKGMGSGWKWLAKLFAIFGAAAGLLGIGTITQINGITSAVKTVFDPNFDAADPTTGLTLFGTTHSWSVVISGIIVTVLVCLVLLGGLQRIAKVATVIVPFMAITYVVLCLTLLVFNLDKLPGALVTIVTAAFSPQAVTGGAVGSIFVAMQKGIARGIFSNEAGLGSAPIAAAAAQSNDHMEQGVVSMLGTFIDTIIICMMTGLCIVITGAWNTGTDIAGAEVTAYAFQQGLPFSSTFSAFALMLCLALFAFTTILGWDYYAERCLEYLTGGKMGPVKVYRWLYIAAVFVGPYLTVSAVWTIADIFNGLMAFPNLIALVALSGVVAAESKKHYAAKAGK